MAGYVIVLENTGIWIIHYGEPKEEFKKNCFWCIYQMRKQVTHDVLRHRRIEERDELYMWQWGTPPLPQVHWGFTSHLTGPG